MRKEWNIETVDITPVAPQKQEENVPLTKKDKIKRFFKKNRRRIFLGVLCSYFVFVLFSMIVSDYISTKTASGSLSCCLLNTWWFGMITERF